MLTRLLISIFCFYSAIAASALPELFEDYAPPQALGMGNAYSADSTGYTALYYNPAGLSKATIRQWEVIPIALEAMPSFSSLGNQWSAKSFGLYQIARHMQNKPGDYYYSRFNFVPAVSKRNFAATFLASFQQAGVSDGTNWDMHSRIDIGPSFGASTNLAGNLLKLGISGRVFFRNEIEGNFPHSELDSLEGVMAHSREGLAAGLTSGMLVTFPAKFLPTFGLVWKDMFNTYFLAPSHTISSLASGKPDTISQSYNAAFSVHPTMGRRGKGTIAVEVKHLERNDIPIMKRVHIGFQWDDERNIYFWLGLSQMQPTAGFALRLPGGNLELGTYAADIGTGSDRRLLLRYTIGF